MAPVLWQTMRCGSSYNDFIRQKYKRPAVACLFGAPPESERQERCSIHSSNIPGTLA